VSAPLLQPDPKDAPNFGWLAPWLARGAHPNPAGYHWLCETAGIKTIVNLRAEDNTEVALAPACGFLPIYIPVRDNTAPTVDQAMQWLKLVAQLQGRPLFIHCQSGHGRTSTFCVIVRLAQGWKLKDALDEEVSRYGFDPQHDPQQVAFMQAIRDEVRAGTLSLPQL